MVTMIAERGNDMGITKIVENNVAYGSKGSEIFMQGKQNLAAVFSEMVQKQREEYAEKIKNGTTEPSYPIGAGSYTKKEWDKLLESFDKAEEAFREELKAEEEKREKEAVKDSNKNSSSNDFSMNMLCCDYISYKNSSEDGLYLIAYDSQGIRCVGEKGCVWEIKFSSQDQYAKVKEFIDTLDPKENLDFICQESFWKDFLKKMKS